MQVLANRGNALAYHMGCVCLPQLNALMDGVFFGTRVTTEYRYFVLVGPWDTYMERKTSHRGGVFGLRNFQLSVHHSC